MSLRTADPTPSCWFNRQGGKDCGDDLPGQEPPGAAFMFSLNEPLSRNGMPYLQEGAVHGRANC